MDKEGSPLPPEGAGTFPPNGWEEVRDYYYGLGVIKEKLSPDEYFVTNPKFYQEVNNFDRTKIEAMAKAYQNKCK